MPADNVIALAGQLAESRRKKKPPPPTPPGSVGEPKQVIRLFPGREPEVLDEVERVLRKTEDFYQFGDRLVHVVWDEVRVEDGEKTVRLHQFTWPDLLERMGRWIEFERWGKAEQAWVVVTAPKLLAETYLARGTWDVPKLLGVVTAPTLRADGSLIDTPGYDRRTGIIFDPRGVSFPALANRPTRADAERALAQLKRLFRSYKFVTPADHSVALSAVLTAVARRALPVAPMHAFSSPVAGSGKSKLVNVAAVIATGSRAAVTSTGKDRFGDAELEKRLIASMLAGDPIVTIDNVDGELGGEFLCQCLTEHTLKPRVLGFSKNVVLPNATAFFATGNQLVVVGDATRRVLVSQVDPQVERPELEAYPFDPVYYAKRGRPIFVVAALTIIRAFKVSGDRPAEAWLGSYEQWSRMVRSALTWLGEPDPVDVLERSRAGDPRLQRLREMAAAWRDAFPGSKAAKVSQLAEAGDEYVNPALHAVLLAIAPSGRSGTFNQEKLAWWLRKNAERVVSVDGLSYRITKDPHAPTGHGTVWMLQDVANPEPPTLPPTASAETIEFTQFPDDELL